MKRARSTSPGRNNQMLTTGASEPTTKFQRIEPEDTEEKDLLWCTLEPTCSPPNEPTCLRSLDELEAHYTRYHAFICRADGCTCVFPTEHYLNLVCHPPSASRNPRLLTRVCSIKLSCMTHSRKSRKNAGSLLYVTLLMQRTLFC
jgi:hypothetical protein